MQDTQFKNELIDIDLEGKTLPAVTASDEGKVLAVEEKSVQAAVLVPEETFVFTNGIMTEINMQNKSLFVEGAECLLTVNGTTTTATVQAVSEPDSGLIVQDNESGITILLEDSTNVSKLYAPNIGTYTVSLYVEGTEYVWSPVEPSGGSGVDFVLTADYDKGSFTNFELTEGTYNSIKTAFNTKGYVIGIFYYEFGPLTYFCFCIDFQIFGEGANEGISFTMTDLSLQTSYNLYIMNDGTIGMN